MQIVESIIAAILVTLIIFLAYRLFRLRAFIKSLSESYMQELADKFLLSKKVEELVQEIESKRLEETDGFLKFISDSRDWAFEYIEEVQKALAEFDEEVSPKFKSAKTSDKLVKEISLAYDKLKAVLPKETETPNN